MIQVTPQMQILLAVEAVDFRKGIDGLSRVYRGLMLELHHAGHNRLSAKKYCVNNPFVNRTKPAKVTMDHSPVIGKLSDIKPLRFCQVRRTGLEKLFNSLIEHYHYLGYCHPVGEQLKYIVYSQQRPVACLAWSSAPRHIGCRDRFIGWSAHSRKKHIHLLAYNTRFLILPWVRVQSVASHILARMAKIVCEDWQAIYHHPIYYLETFVDKQRFAGTCYKPPTGFIWVIPPAGVKTITPTKPSAP